MAGLERAKRDGKAARERLTQSLVASGATTGPLPGDYVLRADVQDCLLDAMTDCFPIARGDIENDTKPSDKPIGADAQGWGICLATYAKDVRARREVYAGYRHRPRYEQDTLDLPFSEIVDYLDTELVSQVTGT